MSRTAPIAFGTLTPAELAQISGELGAALRQDTFNTMSQFMRIMTDPLPGLMIQRLQEWRQTPFELVSLSHHGRLSESRPPMNH